LEKLRNLFVKNSPKFHNYVDEVKPEPGTKQAEFSQMCLKQNWKVEESSQIEEDKKTR